MPRLLAAILTAAALTALPASALASVEPPLPPATSLGAPPIPCFPYGGSHSICPENGFQNPSPPEYMAATYYGTLEIENHIVHEGDDITMDGHTNNGGEPSWGPGGPVVSGCEDSRTEGQTKIPASSSCTWQTTAGSPYPPSEQSSGWQGGWQVIENDFCGFFGCAPSGDYYYVIGTQQAVSGYVLDSAGKPALNVNVAIQGSAGGVSAAVDPTTGFYNALLPAGQYDVSVEQEGPGSYTYGAGEVTACSGQTLGSHCNVDLSQHTGTASFKLPLAVNNMDTHAGPLKGENTIHIYGIGFTGASAVDFIPAGGGTPIPASSFTVDGDEQITAVAPNATEALPAGQHKLETEVQVTNNGASSPANPPADSYSFGTQHTLAGSIVNGQGEPAVSVTVKIVGQQESANPVTDSQGHFSAELQEGAYTVTPQPEGSVAPVASEDCTVSGSSCQVALTKDRSISFQGCVQPNPDGSPLPESTPTPIPGAVSTSGLEAVGCFTAHGNGVYTATKPIRLNGIDVAPVSGSTITVESNASTVTSSGPVEMRVGGLTLATLSSLNWYFQGTNLEVGDIGSAAATFGIGLNIKGVPFAIGSGSSLGSPPLTSSPGQTTLHLQIQLPVNFAANWNTVLGSYQDGAGKSVASVGGVVVLNTTNRKGLLNPQFCAKLANFKPWGPDAFGVGQLEYCYNLATSESNVTGLLEVPAAKPYFDQINLGLGFVGYQFNSAAVQIGGINKPIPLAPGVFWQRAGASFSRDLADNPPISDIAGTAGFSLGPEVNGNDLMSFDGKLDLKMAATPAVYELSGLVQFLRGTPLQFALSSGKLQYYTGGTLNLTGLIGLSYQGNPLIPRVVLTGEASGFWDPTRQLLQILGHGRASFGNQSLNVEALSSNTDLAICDEANKFSVGVDYNYTTGPHFMASGVCDVGAFSPPEPGAHKSAASSSPAHSASAHPAAGPHGASLRLPSHLAGATVAVQGRGGAPLFRLSGPGLDLSTPKGGLSTHKALVISVPATHTTYVNLFSPRGGHYTLTPLPGSAPIATVRYAKPLPHAKVSARVSGSECLRTVTYTASVPGGEHVALYAQDGTQRAFLGTARRRGTLHFAPDLATKGSGQVLEIETRGSLPRGEHAVAGFHTAPLTKPERIGALHVHGGVLTWTAACGAASYRVLVTQGTHRITLSATTTKLTLPGLHGAVNISVTPLAANGIAGPTLTRRLHL
jgi:hypothetical protein